MAFAISSSDEHINLQPFYGFAHSKQAEVFWNSASEPSQNIDETQQTFLSLSDPHKKLNIDDDWFLNIKTTCSNHNLPRKLFINHHLTELELVDSDAPIKKTNWLTSPTVVRRPPSRSEYHWRLISHLSLNHSGFTANNGMALCEQLKLYDYLNNSESQQLISSITGIKTKSTVARITDQPYQSFCHGSEIKINIDEDLLTPERFYLFASIIKNFLAFSCEINTFLQTVITTDNYQQELYRWQPQSGTKQIV